MMKPDNKIILKTIDSHIVNLERILSRPTCSELCAGCDYHKNLKPKAEELLQKYRQQRLYYANI